MKGLILFLLAVGSGPSAFAQGSVSFANNSTCLVCLYNNGLVPAGSVFQAELMYAPDGTPTFQFDSMAVRIGGAANFGPIAGLFNGGGRTVQFISPAGGFGLFQVRVWETAAGSDYRTASFNFGRVGKSDVLRVDTGDPTTVPPGTPASLVAAGLKSFAVGAPLGGNQCVPEPSAFALGLLGLLALGILRRKA